MPTSDNSSNLQRPSLLLIHAYVDGELDVAHSLEVQRQIEADPKLAAQASNVISLKNVLKENIQAETVSSELQSRIRASVGASERFTEQRPTWQALAASALLAVLVSSGATWLVTRSEVDTKMVGVADAHLRSLVASKPFDVASAERHVVRPWFAGKLPYAPVVDLTASGYPLVGARVDVIDTNPVAALVYNRRLHVINLFSRPAAKASAISVQQRSLKGYNVVSWVEGGNEYWAISDLNVTELKSFAELFLTAS